MEISPHKQNLSIVFGTTKFSIDFYQRDYKWNEVPVKRLLDDVFYKFGEAYEANKDIPPSEEIIESKYPWYYLNTYVTNKVDGKVYIVDGQQRLTTLLLFNMALLNQAKDMQIEEARIKWIDSKIAGYSGSGNEFWVDHENDRETLNQLYLDNESVSVDNNRVTSKNLVANYKIIRKYFIQNLDTPHKLETFIFYFLQRLVLIDLLVEQTDVPMVFEVINDRGVKLKPYEILKGKLLGQIDKALLEKKGYNDLWEKRIGLINEYYEDEADAFFRTYLKSKFASTRNEGQKFDQDYHREIFKDQFKANLSLNHDPNGVMNFLDGPFTYYSSLFLKCLDEFGPESTTSFGYNYALDIDGAFMLVLSACKENDPEEKEKLNQVPLELDRLYSLLQLQGAYDSNSFQELLFRISSEIRESRLDEVRAVFDRFLIEELHSQLNDEGDTPFKYSYFKNAGINLNKRFQRYFFARVEEYFSKGLNTSSMQYSVYDLTRKTGSKTGFHVEHILSRNEENKQLFDNDEELFEVERNRLGALLLLKGGDNQSSGNEKYAEKLKTYSGSLIWNETLREDFYKSNIDLRKLLEEDGIHVRAENVFGREQVESRQKVLFEIASLIWD